jgi:hypothetical protein
MEKKVFGTAGADETKTFVRQLLDRAFGHLNISHRTTWRAANRHTHADQPPSGYWVDCTYQPAPTLLGHHHEPRLRAALAETGVLQIGPNLGPGRLDGLDLPAPGEGVLDLPP